MGSFSGLFCDDGTFVFSWPKAFSGAVQYPEVLFVSINSGGSLHH
jgi:hypothetical protein